MNAVWRLAGLVALTASCASSDHLDAPIIDRQVAPQAQAHNLTLEEAGLIASGQLIDIYGLDADPVPVAINSQIVELDGQKVWQLDITSDLTDNDQRIQRHWRMWIGTPTDGPPAVLRAQERS